MIPSNAFTVLYIKPRANSASANAATAIQTAGDFIVMAGTSLTPMEAFEVVLAASEVVLSADSDEVVEPEVSGTPPTPVELAQTSFPRILALELKVMSAH